MQRSPIRATLGAAAICLAPFLAPMVAPGVAHAGGFETGDNGTRSLGRGGAYVAGADEPSAIYYNPAALTRIGGTAATLNLHIFDNNTTFQRAPLLYEGNSIRDPEREINFDLVEQQTPFFPAPMAFASTNFGLDNWAFGVGAYGPSAFGVGSYPAMTRRSADFDGEVCGVYTACADDRQTEADETVATRDGGQAYMMESQSVLLIYPSLSVARLFESANLSIGLTAQLALLFVDFTVGVDGDGSQVHTADDPFNSIERDDFYSSTALSVRGVSGTGILGVLWEPIESIALGASYRPQFGLVGRGNVDLEFPPGLSGAGLSLSEDTARLHLHMPDVVRTGIAYTHRNAGGKEMFDIEFDFVWENWSVMEHFDVQVPGRVNDEAGTLQDRNIPRLQLKRNYDDALSFRLGSDISAFRGVDGDGPVIRVGTSYETSSSPEEWTNIDFTPFARVGATMGFSWHVKKFSIDLAYAYYWSPTREVTNGEYDVLTPLWICEDPSNPDYPDDCVGTTHEPGHPVNNGTYETWSQIFSVGTTYGW